MSFRSFLYKLRKYKKASMPIKVRRVPVLYDKPPNQTIELFGITEDHTTHYLIYISKSFDEDIQIDVLLHEWAHCIVGWEDGENPHTKEWGECYAELYREMVID